MSVLLLLLIGCVSVTKETAPPPPATAESPAPLLNSLGANWSDVVEAAQYFALHRTTDSDRIAGLIQALEVTGVREFVLREAASRALGLAGDPAAVPALIRRLEDPDEYVRRAAAYALGALRSRDAVPALLERMLDPAEVHWVTAAAVHALGEIGDRSVVPALEQFRADHTDFWMEDVSLDATLNKLRTPPQKSAGEL